VDSVALDASAALAMLQQEAGGAAVTALIAGGAAEILISSVNLCEVVTKLIRDGLSSSDALEASSVLTQFLVPFDEEQALQAAAMYPTTRAHGLSLGDRACLALAAIRGAVAWTTDKDWRKVRTGTRVRVIR
jgi:PIN domain nuclease of toxin-antitoxin system